MEHINSWFMLTILIHGQKHIYHKKSTEPLLEALAALVASREFDLEVNTEKTMFCRQNVE